MANDSSGPTKPYQFEIPEEVHKAGIEKAQMNGVAIAPFMLMAYEKFVATPIEKLQKQLREHKAAKQLKARTYKIKPRVKARNRRQA
jgi:hypothetical protein